MKKLIGLTLVLCFGFGISTSQAQSFYPALTISKDLSENANSVIRNEVNVFKVKSTSEGSFYFRQVVTILNEKDHANIFYVPYDKDSKVTQIKATLYDALGTKVRKIKPTEIQDRSLIADFSVYQDDRFKYLEIKHSSYPYTIEFEYEMNLKGMLFVTYQDWMIQSYGQSVEKSSFVIELSKKQQFSYKALNFAGEPTLGERNGRDIYSWNVSNLTAIEKEPYGPKSTDVLPALYLSPDAFSVDNYAGSMKSWQQFGEFMNQLLEGQDELPADMKTEVNNITASAGSDKEKIDRLYSYMQENMRYVSVQLGVGGWQPFSAEYVSTKKYGDCKALSNFMMAMLKEVGIESYPVLIRSGDLNYEVEEDFTTPSFNHMVLHVPSEDYWLECTSNNYPPNYLGSSNENRNVMLVTPEGGKLVKTPIFKAEDNQENHKAVILLKQDGSAEVAVDIYSLGSPHEIYRYAKYQLSQEEKEKWLARSSKLPSFSTKSFSILSSKEVPEAKVSYELSVSRYAAKAGKRLFVPLNLVNGWDDIPSTVEERKNNIYLKEAIWNRDEIILDIPAGYQVESIPVAAKRIEGGPGYYEMKVEKRGGQLVLSRELKLEEGVFPADEYNEIRTFYKEVAKLDAMKIVLIEKKVESVVKGQ